MRFYVILLLCFILLAIPIYSDITFLPILNKNEFKACFWNYCVPTTPNFLLTDIDCSCISNATYCYDISYDPFETPNTCSDFWNTTCNSGTLNDASLSCNGTQNFTGGTDYSVFARVVEIYTNASSFVYGDGMNATCEFYQGSSSTRTNYEYLWYYNTTNWINIQNWTDASFGTFNRSASFSLNSTEGTHIIRCIISFNLSSISNQGMIPDECANITYSRFYDNDDVNFTVSATDTGNLTYEECIIQPQNITVNNSLYLNGFTSSYFYPYSNPFGFLNKTYNSSYEYWNNATLTDTFNSTYNTWSYNQTIQSITWANTLYLNQSFNNSLNVSQANYSNFSNYTIYLMGFASTYYLNISGFNASNITSGTISKDRFGVNVSWINQTNNWTQPQNFTNVNNTHYLSANNVPICEKYYNSSALIWCDCKNSTHAWFVNTC